MGTFAKQSCVALNWAPDGRCWGVHLRRVRDRCAVALFWRSPLAENESLAARLAEGVRCLAARENTVIVAGGSGRRCGLVDIEMPRLPPEDLRNALSFELGKHAPVSPEKLVWGWRALPGADGTHQQVRLAYMREAEWGRWLDAASGLGLGIDIVMPPSAALDPLLAEQEVYFPDESAADGFVLRPSETGGREILRRAAAGEGVFGAFPTPLSAPVLELGGLGAMPPEEQQGYCGAVLLAMYGLTNAAATDKRTWFPIPYALQPRRHRHSRLAAAVLILYLLAVAAVGLGREYRTANAYYRQLQQECKEIEAQIAEQEEAEDVSDFMSVLEKELGEAHREQPSMTDVLAELTHLIGEDTWVERFEWAGDTLKTVQIHLNTKKDEGLGLINRLEGSPVLGDVVPGPVTRRNDEIKRRLEMNARFDTEAEERELLEEPLPQAPSPPSPPSSPPPPPPPPGS